MKSRSWIGASAAAVVALSLVAAAPLPQRVLTTEVWSNLDFGNPEQYVQIAVLDRRIAEVRNATLIVTARPFRGIIDWRGRSRDWKTSPQGRATTFDVTNDQLARVERGIRAMGFAKGAVTGWMLGAPALSFEPGVDDASSVRVGEVIVDVGRLPQATANVARLAREAPTAFAGIEKRTGTHLAFGAADYRADCAVVLPKARAVLAARAQAETDMLQQGVGLQLRFLDIK